MCFSREAARQSLALGVRRLPRTFCRGQDLGAGQSCLCRGCFRPKRRPHPTHLRPDGKMGQQFAVQHPTCPTGGAGQTISKCAIPRLALDLELRCPKTAASVLQGLCNLLVMPVPLVGVPQAPGRSLRSLTPTRSAPMALPAEASALFCSTGVHKST